MPLSRGASVAIFDVDQKSVFFGGVWLRELWEAFGRGLGIGEGGRSGEWRGIVQDFDPVLGLVPERKLLLHVGEGGEHDLARVGEDSGFAKGDTILGDGDEEFAEDVVDVGSGEEIAVEGGGNFIAETLRLEALQFLPGMEGAEGRMDRSAQHAAAAAVGKLKLAARGNTSAGILVGHGSLLEVDLCYREERNTKLEGQNSRCGRRVDGKIGLDLSRVKVREGKKTAAQKAAAKLTCV